MTWMGYGDRPEEAELTGIQKAALDKMAEHLDKLAGQMSNEPIDPKIEALLRMASDCLREQVQLNKFYPWDRIEIEETETETKEKPNSPKEYLLLENSDKKVDESSSLSPSVEELESWLGNKEPGNDGETK